eukprot:347005-Pelagomonas_calceolata.AAC.4
MPSLLSIAGPSLGPSCCHHHSHPTRPPLLKSVDVTSLSGWATAGRPDKALPRQQESFLNPAAVLTYTNTRDYAPWDSAPKSLRG